MITTIAGHPHLLYVLSCRNEAVNSTVFKAEVFSRAFCFDEFRRSLNRKINSTSSLKCSVQGRNYSWDNDISAPRIINDDVSHASETD